MMYEFKDWIIRSTGLDPRGAFLLMFTAVAIITLLLIVLRLPN